MADIEIPYPRPHRILSIDPGERAGIAVFIKRDGSFVLDGAWEVENRVKPVSETITRFAGGSGPGVVVLERQYFKQINGLETLLRYRHEWEIIATVFGLPSVLIYPSSWQSKMLSGKGRQKKDPEGNAIGPDSKEQALEACSKLWPGHDDIWLFHEDARDAALIGRFYANLLEK